MNYSVVLSIAFLVVVSVAEAAAYLGCDVEGYIDGNQGGAGPKVTQNPTEWHPVDEFHRDEQRSLVLAELKDLDYVGML